MNLYDYIDEILDTPINDLSGIDIGRSIGGRAIKGFQFGNGSRRVSLIAGNHADEPIGPLLLKKLVSFLSSLDDQHDLLKTYSWWIVPHGNPDGEYVNMSWYSYNDSETDLAQYLINAVRELPGEDIEFGFPIEGVKGALRPENQAMYAFWKAAEAPFDLHVSLHGMKATYGPWFLIDEAWIDHTEKLRNDCAHRTRTLGYELFDLDRKGEKGFKRIDEGFCTRPDSQGMIKHFRDLGGKVMAGKFHPSSMESIRSLGGDCLTLVSELPLFLYPKQDRILNWPDPYLQGWSDQFNQWKLRLLSGSLTPEKCNEEASKKGVRSMLWKDQMRLQWQLIVSGLEAI